MPGGMILLKEFFHDEGLNLAGRTLERASAKAIIWDGRRLLMIYSAQGGGYKFPGGGVDGAESDQQTLAREIEEECGARLVRIAGEFGQVVEYKRPFDPGYAVFKMISRYYLCQVEAGAGVLRLDDYEAALGFRPVWVEIDDALVANNALLHAPEGKVSSWLAREILILGLLQERF